MAPKQNNTCHRTTNTETPQAVRPSRPGSHRRHPCSTQLGTAYTIIYPWLIPTRCQITATVTRHNAYGAHTHTHLPHTSCQYLDPTTSKPTSPQRHTHLSPTPHIHPRSIIFAQPKKNLKAAPIYRRTHPAAQRGEPTYKKLKLNKTTSAFN
jgi:hypothetical protein